MEKLLAILRSLHDDVDYATARHLVDERILDSLDIVTLVTEIHEAFDVTIPPEELIPDNFNSAEAIYALICRLDED